ncbi:hypothetical protein [Rhodospirillum centenum]|uniref:Uncharacterized protein n=1 Tax=Rhodospirillum centenum (strain ATCC 51521 / SW) TaxID=414684 RepID=B6IQW1_RHOCS|nr:hypothetical protein [Rhodospirillum centenum]ACI97847.1 hypothetical protein RC1_0408 [Rhodospirillum centenum SW]
MRDDRSVTALVLYAVGGGSVFVSLFLLTSPTVDTFAPGLIGLLLGFVLLGLGRVCAHLARIQGLLERRG